MNVNNIVEKSVVAINVEFTTLDRLEIYNRIVKPYDEILAYAAADRDYWCAKEDYRKEHGTTEGFDMERPKSPNVNVEQLMKLSMVLLRKLAIAPGAQSNVFSED